MNDAAAIRAQNSAEKPLLDIVNDLSNARILVFVANSMISSCWVVVASMTSRGVAGAYHRAFVLSSRQNLVVDTGDAGL